MEYRKITAIILSEHLEIVEKALIKMRISGISVSQVRGYGEYRNFFQKDMMCQNARLEIFCQESEAKAIVRCIMDTAHTGLSTDGIVAVLPVEKLYHICAQSAGFSSNVD